ncbi:phytanoyl-CoA dioxygenase family protein [Prosthecomicrobium sp. N25]|uniref:phytanoyl-CoA dioxygenase family protein n=1 Tax=Prosthecomicrobium sp. N25 TaxID=3129254 RepID=UPI003077B73D
MKAIDWLKSPLYAAEILGSAKSFRHNPILGNARLNEMGLHKRRVELAARMAERRRAALAAAVPAEDRAAFDRDGFLIKPDFLPADAFARLKDRLYNQEFEAREMRQGQTVTRMIPLDARTLPQIPEAAHVVRNDLVRSTMRYVASTGGTPVYHLQTVIAEPERGKADPQTELHSDTFHPTAKVWLFLQDVGPEDGPFLYAPGSHRLTPERLAWEYEQSLTAGRDKRAHHALGSFRVRPEDFARFDYAPPRQVTVAANTLVYADTYGFHARSVSTRPTLRMEIHGYLRRNPFLPFVGLDPLGIPGVAERQLDIYLAWCDLREKVTGRRNVWRPVGKVTPASPAHV